MNAYLLIRETPQIRRNAFATGLRACGYAVHDRLPAIAQPGDVIVVWNGLITHAETKLRAAQRRGARLLIAENAYIGRDDAGAQMYALAEGGHNASGRWTVGDQDRWTRLGIPLRPWREGGRHIVVCAQRGIGTAQMRSPPDWAQRTALQLRRLTVRPVVIREHGGKPAFHAQTTADMQRLLEDAWAVVVWSSANGVRALVEGVPVIYQAPHWIAAGAACNDLRRIHNPPRPDRLPVMQRLAWAQWTADEIASGKAIAALLGIEQREAA